MFDRQQNLEIQIQLWKQHRIASGKWQPGDEPNAGFRQLIHDMDCLMKRAGRALQYPEIPGDPSPCD